jgi:hypothetical protein
MFYVAPTHFPHNVKVRCNGTASLNVLRRVGQCGLIWKCKFKKVVACSPVEFVDQCVEVISYKLRHVASSGI